MDLKKKKKVDEHRQPVRENHRTSPYSSSQNGEAGQHRLNEKQIRENEARAEQESRKRNENGNQGYREEQPYEGMI
ncbi:hypothetical protein D9M68_757160 [compost metagenome]